MISLTAAPFRLTLSHRKRHVATAQPITVHCAGNIFSTTLHNKG